MLIKDLLMSITVIVSWALPTSTGISANFEELKQEESSSIREEIPELRERNHQSSLRKFKNQANPEEIPSRSIDPIQGGCDQEKTRSCDKK